MAVSQTYTFNVTYSANGGSGAPATQSNSVTSSSASVSVSITLSSTIPTKSGYTFNGWWNNGTRYNPGQTVSHLFRQELFDQTYTLALSAAWYVTSSTWSTGPSSVQLDGSTSYTYNISKASNVDHHTVTFTLGTETITYENVGTSVSVTFPTSWQSQIPNSTTGTIIGKLYSYNANDVQIGNAVQKSITANVPSGVVPTLSLAHSAGSDNATVASWGVLLQGFSYLTLTATAAGTNGSTIASISFSGAGLQTTGTATSATSDVLSVTGSQTWTVTATDSRGRTATQTYTETVYSYSPPSISNATARRCRQNGTIDEAAGTYASYNATYAYTDANGNNALTEIIESKLHSGSTWTTLANSYTSGTDEVIGGSLDADKTYDIRLTITDSLGNSAEYSIFLASVQGFALGLKNDRARFGGIPVRAGLQIDWPLYLGNKRLLTSLWTGSWTTGDITVDGISQYYLLMIRMDGQTACILAMPNTDNGTTYIQGEGGYCPNNAQEVRYYFNATLSGDTLTYVNCHSINQSGSRNNRTVTEIIGLI